MPPLYTNAQAIPVIGLPVRQPLNDVTAVGQGAHSSRTGWQCNASSRPADTRPKAEQAIRATLAAYLDAHPDSAPTSHVRVVRVSDGSKVQLVGVGALLGTGRSRRKARASQLNGRLGGRPRTTARRKNA